eukprot:TRINITY_DN5591_c0_g1_i2.p1 TRINITY_DN5591_c0_g1~~TRINITY_DN5591_c0_g1_i2.p1  ORF type:complete len:193 (-),score=27.66 TRINITY_DN5591_c0_g1_i2:63-641(-)
MNNTIGVEYPYLMGVPDTTTIQLFRVATDPLEDQLFEHEKEALEVAKTWEIASYFPDQFILACIFSRKFDMQRVKEMLEDCHETRVSSGVDWPVYEEIEKSLLFNLSYFGIPGARTKEGCGILYMRLKYMEPDTKLFNYADAMFRLMMWNHKIGIYIDGMDIHRNGFYLVLDLKGLGFKHINLDMQRKAWGL